MTPGVWFTSGIFLSLNSLPGTEVQATGFSAIAMQEGSSDVIEIRLPEHSHQLEVLLNHKALNFSEQNWMDLTGRPG